MCNMQVDVVVVEPHQLDAPWATAIDAAGNRTLLVRRTATPVEVAEGYHRAQVECPVRLALTKVA